MADDLRVGLAELLRKARMEYGRRLLEGGHYLYMWLDATYLKARQDERTATYQAVYNGRACTCRGRVALEV